MKPEFDNIILADPDDPNCQCRHSCLPIYITDEGVEKILDIRYTTPLQDLTRKNMLSDYLGLVEIDFTEDGQFLEARCSRKTFDNWGQYLNVYPKERGIIRRKAAVAARMAKEKEANECH